MSSDPNPGYQRATMLPSWLVEQRGTHLQQGGAPVCDQLIC
ncbi:MAG TPA: hypothetical protein PK177_00155 [Burkholderiaceae bacterium]|nr:hypothetical protein [Burkholderiaceae bacterium]